MSYDRYDLLVEETRDALGNRVSAGTNADPTQPLARAPRLPGATARDGDGTQPQRSAVAFDALGLVAGTAVMGKPEESPVPGDRLSPTFRTDLTRAEIDQLLADLKGPLAATLLDAASARIVYDVDAYRRDPAGRAPALGATFARETHASDPLPADGLRIQVSISYSDGFGRRSRRKPKPSPDRRQRDRAGAIVLARTASLR